MHISEYINKLKSLGFKCESDSSFIFTHNNFKLVVTFPLYEKVELSKTVKNDQLGKINFYSSYEKSLDTINKELKILKLKDINESLSN